MKIIGHIFIEIWRSNLLSLLCWLLISITLEYFLYILWKLSTLFSFVELVLRFYPCPCAIHKMKIIGFVKCYWNLKKQFVFFVVLTFDIHNFRIVPSRFLYIHETTFIFNSKENLVSWTGNCLGWTKTESEDKWSAWTKNKHLSTLQLKTFKGVPGKLEACMYFLEECFSKFLWT